jgi:hypothetical protein
MTFVAIFQERKVLLINMWLLGLSPQSFSYGIVVVKIVTIVYVVFNWSDY